MNAGSLYVGDYYAWSPNPRKGHFTMGCQKVRLRSVETQRSRWEKNAKTFANVTLVERDPPKEMRVRARELVDFWDDWKREYDMIMEEQLERERERMKRNLRDQMVGALISHKLREKIGVEINGTVSYSPYSEQITLNARPILEWLGITDEDIEGKVEERMLELEQSEGVK